MTPDEEATKNEPDEAASTGHREWLGSTARAANSPATDSEMDERQIRLVTEQDLRRALVARGSPRSRAGARLGRRETVVPLAARECAGQGIRTLDVHLGNSKWWSFCPCPPVTTA
jgi:hypothetical protein